MTNMSPVFPIITVFLGCCSNVVFLELIVREDPGSGNLVTFAQFLFIALQGFIFTTNYGRKKPVIPLSSYVVMVTLFFVISVVNNFAFAFDIPMPLHMIFRAGSLIANLVLGVIILNKRYKLQKYLAVVMITVGILLATVASADENAQVQDVKGGKEEGVVEYAKMSSGIAVLTLALFLSARMGIFQETIYKKYGKHPSEALFYNHALPLPGFLFLSSDIYAHAQIFNQSAPIILPLVGVGIPKLWVYLVGNVLTQYVCIKSVFILTTECTSLTVTLVVTLRKFTSLIFSIVYFSNPFTTVHWFATCLVFGGTLVFTDIYGSVFAQKEKKNEEIAVKNHVDEKKLTKKLS